MLRKLIKSLGQGGRRRESNFLTVFSRLLPYLDNLEKCQLSHISVYPDIRYDKEGPLKKVRIVIYTDKGSLNLYSDDCDMDIVFEEPS